MPRAKVCGKSSRGVDDSRQCTRDGGRQCLLIKSDKNPMGPFDNHHEDSAEFLRHILDRALDASSGDPLDVLAAVLEATNRDGLDEELNLHGQRAGQWRLLRVIGVGGMGVTYEAVDDAGSRAAVKVVGRVKAGAIVRFEAECNALEHLDNPGVVRYLGRGRMASGRAFMVMEFVNGCHLGRLVDDLRAGSEGPVACSFREQASGGQDAAIRLFCRIIRDAARALESIHQEGLVHRDVKPGNIMVRPDLSAVLIDFGLSRDAFRNDAVTQTAAIVGTLRYMAPEQGRASSEADRRSDVYSLGLVLGYCVGGSELLEAVKDRNRPWRKPSFVRLAQRKGIPGPIQAILYRAVQFWPRDRYRSAGMLARDLEHFLDGKPVQTKIPGRLARLGMHPRFRLVASVVTTALVAVFLTLLFRPAPYLVTIDTINDGGIVTVDGNRRYVAPVLDLELAPGRHDLVYEYGLCRTVRRTFTVDRHYSRINLRTIGKSLEAETSIADVDAVGLLNIQTGSPTDVVWIDGHRRDSRSRWQNLSPGWHEVMAEGFTRRDSGGPTVIRESVQVFIEPDTISSVLLLPVDLRDFAGDHRFTLGDISQATRPALKLDLDDGLVFWMNDFKDSMPRGDNHLHVRTCIAPVVVDRELSTHLRYDFPRPMQAVRVVWHQTKSGPGAHIKAKYRFGNGQWIDFILSRDDPKYSRDTGGMIQSNPGDIPKEGVEFFEMQITATITQRPSGFPTAEIFFGYFDEHTVSPAVPAFAIAARSVRR